jgi:hypothetical protein
MSGMIELAAFRSRPVSCVLFWGVILHEYLHAAVARRWGCARVGWLPRRSWWETPAACVWAIPDDAPEWAEQAINGAPMLVLPLAVSWTYLGITVATSGVSLLTVGVLAWTITNGWLVAIGGPLDVLNAVNWGSES